MNKLKIILFLKTNNNINISITSIVKTLLFLISFFFLICSIDDSKSISLLRANNNISISTTIIIVLSIEIVEIDKNITFINNFIDFASAVVLLNLYNVRLSSLLFVDHSMN